MRSNQFVSLQMHVKIFSIGTLKDYDVKSVALIGEDERLHHLKEAMPAEDIEASVLLAALVKLHVRYPRNSGTNYLGIH